MLVPSLHTKGLIGPFCVPRVGQSRKAEASRPKAPLAQHSAPLRQNLIDLADDFTGMLEALLDFPQQLFLFVIGHFPPSEVAFSNTSSTHRNSNSEGVTGSTKGYEVASDRSHGYA